jgi:hypothetical protein
MSKRFHRVGFLALPVAAATFALISACSDDETVADVANDDAAVPVLDGSNAADGNVADGAKSDSSVVSDAGADADAATDTDASDEDASDGSAEAEASVTPLCTTYPSADISGDAAAPNEPPTEERYRLIARRALMSGEQNASIACEISQAFQDPDTAPTPLVCFAAQLKILAGCASGPYEAVNDDEGAAPCVTDGGSIIQLGFRDPQNGNYSNADVDYLIHLVREAAVSTGMATGDADRLAALLATQKEKVVSVDAGPDDGGFSNPNCP